MLNRLKEITLFKVKFPLNIRGVSYIILLHCFFPPVEKFAEGVTQLLQERISRQITEMVREL